MQEPPAAPPISLGGARLDGGAVRPLVDRDSSAQKTLAAVEVLVRRGAGQAGAEPGDFVETLDF